MPIRPTTVSAGNTGYATASCPSGSVVGGGFASNPDALWVYNSSMSGNGWQVWAKNTSGSGQLVNAYAICLSGTSGTTQQIMQSVSISAGATGNASPTCGAGMLVTGGGLAA